MASPSMPYTQNERSSTSASSRPVWQIDVVGAERVKATGHTEYQFKLAGPSGEIHERQRRYSVLRELHKQLQELYPELLQRLGAAFPGKSLLGGLSVVKERQQQLDRYFKAVFLDPTLSESIALRFGFAVTDGLTWYSTLSACPVCSFVDMAGIQWGRACMREHDGRIQLHVHCSKHGDISTIYCESAAFFHRLARRQLYCPALTPHRDHRDHWLGRSTTAQEQAKQMSLATRSECTVLDISLAGPDGRLITDQQVAAICAGIRDSTLILKVQSKLATAVDGINEKLHKIVDHSKGHSIIAEMPHDRLIALARTPGSVLLKRRVTPAVPYFLRKGDELRCHCELVATISELSRIQGIDLHVYLHIERPFPDLTEILAMLRRHSETVRVIKFCVCRPRSEIIRSAQMQSSVSSLPFSSGPGAAAGLPTVDFYELIKHIEACTDGDLGPDDFISQSAGTLLEPMLPHLGYSRFKFRPCDTAGAIAVLMQSKEQGSVSANRLIDLEGFVDKLQPLLAKKSVMSGLAIATLVKRSFKQSIRADAAKAVPSLAALSTESLSSPPDVLLQTQLVLVQRSIDLAALDMEHLLAPVEYTGVVSSLMGSL